ncbi:MAG: O-antigen ligase family protein [Betaproteobacteria bacterium]
MIAHCVRWLQVAAAAYLALLPTNALNFWRSAAFGLGGVLALFLVGMAVRGRGPRITSPGAVVLAALVAWCAWACASLAWTVDPAYTLHELKHEIGYSLVVMATFYVAAGTEGGWRTLVVAAIASFAFIAALALGLAQSAAGWDPGRWHAGVGPYSTYIVLVSPLLPMLAARPPAGFGRQRTTLTLVAALMLLLLATARITENRMVWLALGAVFVTIAALLALRWRGAAVNTPARRAMPLVVLLIVLAGLFVDVARDKSQQLFPGQATVSSLANDPRFAVWEYTALRIGERPWLGYGFGKLIVEADFRRDLANPLLSHAHNVFLSQWLQLGAVGLAAFTALLAALTWRFARFMRSRSDTVAVVGIVGLSLIAGFVVKNLSDDFLIQSNAKEFWALTAMLLGFGCARERANSDAFPSG